MEKTKQELENYKKLIIGKWKHEQVEFNFIDKKVGKEDSKDFEYDIWSDDSGDVFITFNRFTNPIIWQITGMNDKYFTIRIEQGIPKTFKKID